MSNNNFEKQIVMMQDDWIPMGPLPQVEELDESAFRQQMSSMEKIVPQWARDAKAKPVASEMNNSLDNFQFRIIKTPTRNNCSTDGPER